MFGIMEALLSFIRRQVGLRTDAASASGSLHAKVAEFRSTLLARNDIVASTRQAPRSRKAAVNYYNGDTTYVTVLNLSGKGALQYLGAKANTTDKIGYVKVLVDGALVCQGMINKSDALYYPSAVTFLSPSETVEFSDSVMVPLNINFKSSLQIQVKAYNATCVIYTYAQYELE